jgi:2-dehydropantoate 2-reductase
MESELPVLILGTGAMACLFAARLAAIGINVKMLGSWPDGLRALRTQGVRIIEADGSESTYKVTVTSDPEQCAGTRYALVLVKSWQTLRATQQLETCLQVDGLALTLQNGLDNYPILKTGLGSDRAALGVTTLGATLLEPGKVRVGGNGTITLGRHERLERVLGPLVGAGFQVEIVENTDTLVWGKLVINAAINPLTALLRVPNGELLNKPAARAVMGIIAKEAADVAAAQGIRLPYPDPIAAVGEVARHTASNYSSMLRDILRGGPTEIDAINGAIVRVGRQFNVPTPVNHILWRSVKSLEMERGFGIDKESAIFTKPGSRPAPRKRQTTLSTIQQH